MVWSGICSHFQKGHIWTVKKSHEGLNARAPTPQQTDFLYQRKAILMKDSKICLQKEMGK